MPTARSGTFFSLFALSLWPCSPFTASYRRGTGGDEPGRSAQSLAYIGAVTCVFGAGRQTGNLSIVLRINTPSECICGAKPSFTDVVIYSVFAPALKTGEREYKQMSVMEDLIRPQDICAVCYSVGFKYSACNTFITGIPYCNNGLL